MKQYILSFFFIGVLGLCGINQAHASIKSELQNAAQKLQMLSDKKQIKQALEHSNTAQTNLNKSELAKLRQQWRMEVRQKRGPLLQARTHNQTVSWLKKKQASGHVYSYLLSNASGYNVAQTMLTKSIRPRFVTNALKKGLRTAKISRTYKDSISKLKVVRITVPVRDNNKTIGLLTALIDKAKLSSIKKS